MAALELEGIAKRYRRKAVLEGVTHAFAPGLTLLAGPSGAGKTTLLRIIATAEGPSAGRMRWDGTPLPRARRALRRTLGYAPQAVDLPEDLTAREFAMHVAALKGLALGAADRQFAAITDAIGLHPDINNRIATFSGGMRRRLIFAQALLGKPELLALDEPTSELDPETARCVNALILERARDAIVIMTSHAIEALAQHGKVLRVEGGAVVPA
ncbi:ABC transporter ATP-binding protein [Sphingomonas sp.]|uniref:ATP-binding cassette domain-containing protein n=1 Tax=Sphingomonas sp. TaxID=28214 RepID=UPI001B2B80C0|nr:ABC transporter ATP-binding protein [Sphingomonas sp.]MBO9714348.1 ABC transporter ATP-binding protein [Sphingomonas sp.]